MNHKNDEILFKKFRIISCYKKNEHSAVYLANHIFLEKKVFLKILNTDTIPDSQITERFKREAKILAQIEHSNIIKVFDFGMYEEYFYISFEYFDSENLRELLARENLSNETKRNIFIQLVKSLDFAHKKDVIHRDIKPENILINKNYELKLTDFGLAQDSLDNLITQQYSLVGTPAYMSPEQIQGQKLTIQSDLFSLGINTIELFSGKNPFLGQNSSDTINNIISFDEDQNAELFEGFDEDVRKILKGILVANPENRFNSCTEILNILKIQNENSTPKNKPLYKKRWIALAAIFILAAAYFSYSLIQNDDSYPIENSNTAVLSENPKDSVSSAQNTADTLHDEIVEENTSRFDKNSLADNNKSESDLKEVISATPVVKNKLPEKGELFVKCFPWAKIYLNNEYLETTPLANNLELNTGSYLLTLVHPDYPNYSDSVFISSENLSFVEVNLDTLFGYLECQVYPWGELFINGEKKGTTPLENSIRLFEGTYNLELKNPKYKSVQLPITISKNDTFRIRINMESGVNY